MAANNSNLLVGWKVASLAFNIASVRYRAILPILALEQNGLACHVFSDNNNSRLSELDFLIVVKSFGTDDLALVQNAADLGLPIVLDLCDNIFVDGYGASISKSSPAQNFLAMAKLCKCIVVTTESLEKVLLNQLNGQIPVHIIPDGLETPGLLAQIQKRIAVALTCPRTAWHQKQRARIYRLLKVIRTVHFSQARPIAKNIARRVAREMHWRPWAKRAYRHFDRLRKLSTQEKQNQTPALPPVDHTRSIDPNTKRILWFGNHGAPYARFGMLDLLEIREPLETIATEFNVELVVMSNNREKYDKYLKPLKIPSTYVEWSPAGIKEHLALASVVVVPSTRDAFSVCKSANRTATALLAGVPVVATSTSALDTLRDCVVLDDFLGGLRVYLTDKDRVASDVLKGNEKIHREFGQAAIASKWMHVINHTTPAKKDNFFHGELVVALNIVQDFDILLPIILETIYAGVSVIVYCNINLAKSHSHILDYLHKSDIPTLLLPEDVRTDRKFHFPPLTKALLTAAESNLKPHRFTRLLTEAANDQNIYTATTQHGFENVGLTYTDEIHPIKNINFAARKIYIWGQLETLHPKINLKTKNKCIPIGCPKFPLPPKAELVDVLHGYKTIIGVFENLHWHRFSEKYKSFFIHNVQRMAHLFPHALFLIKPHNAGRWLTSRFAGAVPNAKNILIADPQSPLWARHTAPSLMGYFQAVITTPSTVAVDAARQYLPVAVIAHQMTIPKYEPLTLIHTENHWLEFLQKSLNLDSRNILVENSRKFVNNNLLGEGAAKRIAQDIISRGEINRKAQQ